MGGDDEAKYRELGVDPAALESFSSERALWHEPAQPEDEGAGAVERRALRDEAVRLLGTILTSQLTERQQQVVELYFFQGKTQQEIAEQLGISQQVVSRQLFGVMRDGKKIGGALTKLKKLLEKEGISF